MGQEEGIGPERDLCMREYTKVHNSFQASELIQEIQSAYKAWILVEKKS